MYVCEHCVSHYTVAACKGRISLRVRASEHVRCQTNKLKTHPSLGNKTREKNSARAFQGHSCCKFHTSAVIRRITTVSSFPARDTNFISFRIHPRLFPLPYRRQLRSIWISLRSMAKNLVWPYVNYVDYSITYSLATRVGKKKHLFDDSGLFHHVSSKWILYSIPRIRALVYCIKESSNTFIPLLSSPKKICHMQHNRPAISNLTTVAPWEIICL